MTQKEFNKLDENYEVCLCVGVSLGEIKTVIENGAITLEKIMQETEAGTRCEMCQSKKTDEDSDKELHLDEILEFMKKK